MKRSKTVLIVLLAVFMMISIAYAESKSDKGKALFNDPNAFGGSVACSSCHPDGKGLENAAAKKKWMTPAGSTKTLQEAINLCIVNANKGKALDVKSKDMKYLIAYIKSLKSHK